MDNNYEAQSQFTKQRLAARREQARVERLICEGYPQSRRGIRQFLVQIFRRSGRRREKKPSEESQFGDLAVSGNSKGK